MLSLLILSALISQVLGRALITPRQSNSGQATFYTGNVAGGTCSFSTYTLPAGLYGTALSSSNWDNAANCGACVSVTGPGGNSVTAMVCLFCPSSEVFHPLNISSLDRRPVPQLRNQPPRSLPERLCRSSSPRQRHHQRELEHRRLPYLFAFATAQQGRRLAILL